MSLEGIESVNGVEFERMRSCTSFRLSAAEGVSSTPATLTSWERPDGTLQGSSADHNAAVSESSGIFTFNQLGLYFLIHDASWHTDGTSGAYGRGAFTMIQMSNNGGSNWSSTICQQPTNVSPATSGSTGRMSQKLFLLFEVVDTGDDQLRVRSDRFSESANLLISGNTDESRTTMIFLRI